MKKQSVEGIEVTTGQFVGNSPTARSLAKTRNTPNNRSIIQIVQAVQSLHSVSKPSIDSLLDAAAVPKGSNPLMSRKRNVSLSARIKKYSLENSDLVGE